MSMQYNLAEESLKPAGDDVTLTRRAVSRKVTAAMLLLILSGFWVHSTRVETRSGFPEFQYHVIDNIGSQLGQTALADLDNDGDLDWVAGQADRTGGDIWWWEYRGPDQWLRHPVGKGHTDVGGAAFDVNGDGWIDILSGSRLLLNTGNPRTEAFQEYEVGTTYSHDTEFADINGDGKMDAIANWDGAGLFWYEIPADPRQPWPSHLIAAASVHKVHGGVSPRSVGDLDGDGDADVVTAQAWYENLDGSGLQWKPHQNIHFGEHDRYGLAVRTWVADLDGDGDLDFVQSEADHPDGRVAWFENDGSGNWTLHLIKDKGDRQDFHALAVADFDLDGDLDVFAGGGPLSAPGQHKSYIWENTAGPNGRPTSEKWVEHIVARKPVHEAEAGDVDGDGDIDIVAKPWSVGNEHFYLRNMAIEGRPGQGRANTGSALNESLQAELLKIGEEDQRIRAKLQFEMNSATTAPESSALWRQQEEIDRRNLVLCPIEDEANVDIRRAAVGLPPLAEYLKLFGLKYTPPEPD